MTFSPKVVYNNPLIAVKRDRPGDIVALGGIEGCTGGFYVRSEEGSIYTEHVSNSTVSALNGEIVVSGEVKGSTITAGRKISIGHVERSQKITNLELTGERNSRVLDLTKKARRLKGEKETKEAELWHHIQITYPRIYGALHSDLRKIDSEEDRTRFLIEKIIGIGRYLGSKKRGEDKDILRYFGQQYLQAKRDHRQAQEEVEVRQFGAGIEIYGSLNELTRIKIGSKQISPRRYIEVEPGYKHVFRARGASIEESVIKIKENEMSLEDLIKNQAA